MPRKQVWLLCRSVSKDPKVCSDYSIQDENLDSVIVSSNESDFLILFKNCINVFLCVYSGVVEPVEVVDNGDQTHTVNYVPTREGPYSINVLYADEEIPRR